MNIPWWALPRVLLLSASMPYQHCHLSTPDGMDVDGWTGSWPHCLPLWTRVCSVQDGRRTREHRATLAMSWGITSPSRASTTRTDQTIVSVNHPWNRSSPAQRTLHPWPLGWEHGHGDGMAMLWWQPAQPGLCRVLTLAGSSLSHPSLPACATYFYWAAGFCLRAIERRSWGLDGSFLTPSRGGWVDGPRPGNSRVVCCCHGWLFWGSGGLALCLLEVGIGRLRTMWL